jgi:hypothetical protein
MPQQNNLVKLGFAILANHGRALLIGADVQKKECYLLWLNKAFGAATLLDGLCTIEIDGKLTTHYVHFAKEKSGIC